MENTKSMVNAPLKEKYHNEKAKLKQMTFKEKVAYIWEYYKYIIIGFAVAILIIASLLNSFINPKPTHVLYIMWNSGFVTMEQTDNLASVLERQLVEDGNNEDVVVSHFPFNISDAQSMVVEVQRTAAMIAARMIDMFVVNTDLFEFYTASGYFMPLESVLEDIRERNPAVYSRIEEHLVYGRFQVDETSQEERVLGIHIGKSPLLMRLGFVEQNIFICVALNTDRIDNVIEAIILLFE